MTRRAAAVPASAGQRQIWLAEQLRRRDLGAVDAAYSTAEAMTVQAELDESTLRSALRRLAERHEVLRTTFDVPDGVLLQQIHPDPRADIEWHDLHGHRDHAAEFARLAAASLERPFPLDRPPLWRVLVATADAATHIALILHHIAADGWSVALLLDDLAALYLAANGAGPEPAPPSRTYLQFSEEQRCDATTDQRDASTAYWRQAMRDAPTWSAPPWLGPQPREAMTTRAAQHFLPLDRQRYESVCRVAANNHVTPYVVFLSAFILALTRSVRRADVVTALPSANRDDDQYADVVGPFATLLPIRVRLPRAVSPGTLVRLVADTVADVTKHQDVPLADIVSAARLGSSRTDMPLFQTVALPRDWRDPECSFAGFPARMVWTAAPAAKYHLMVSFPTNAQDARFVIEYDVHRYDQAMTEAFGRALDSSLDDVLGQHEITTLSAPPTGTGDTTIHQQVAILARHAPDHPAVVAGRDWCSYGDLDARARAAAAGLARCGVRSGDLVGITLERGIDFVIAVLACLHTGAAYVATDPAWPLPRIQQVLAEAAVVVSIVPDDATRPDATDGPLVMGLAELADCGTGYPADLPTVDPGAPCYVCFTSGSAGIPKGVVITHRSVRRLAAADQVFALDWTDRMGHQANVAFDATTWELWGALLVGATVVAGVDAAPAPADYAMLLADCTTAFLTTGLFAELARHPACQVAIAGLRVLGVGGSALLPGSIEPILRADRKQFNFYGPTECTTTATAGPMAARTPWNTVPAGPPIAGTRAYVLDHALRQVPDGEVGDLYLAGAGVALGYLGDSRRTAARFLPDVEVAGERMYATGDRARRLDDGALDYVGRADRQLKIRGFRVEPGEIEAVLLDRPDVHEAYVGLDDQDRLAAAVRADQGADPLRLAEQLRAVLPEYMIPHRIAVVNRIPLTRNGKVDVAALLRAAGQGPPDGTLVGGENGLLGRVIELWAVVLGPSVRRDTEFFVAGGDSLTALRLLSTCGEEFGVELRPLDLYAYSTPAAFAAVLAERMEHSDESA